MIGDIVLRKSDDKVVKIDGIITQDDGSCLLSTQDGLSFDYMLEPVKITPELLIENEFELEHGALYDLYSWEDCEYGYRIVFHPKEGNYTRGGYNYIHMDVGCITIEELPVEYVHELQHAFRLCGIDSEFTFDCLHVKEKSYLCIEK